MNKVAFEQRRAMSDSHCSIEVTIPCGAFLIDKESIHRSIIHDLTEYRIYKEFER